MPVLRYHASHGFDIDFGLAAAGDPLQYVGTVGFRVSRDRVDRLDLLLVQCKSPLFYLFRYRAGESGYSPQHQPLLKQRIQRPGILGLSRPEFLPGQSRRTAAQNS